MTKSVIIRFSVMFLIGLINTQSFGQSTDSVKVISNFGGAVSVTNNGISFIPTFSLGKPAVIFDMNVGRKLSFEPQFRFSLEGRPWSFVFWWRYRPVKTEHFGLTVGAHPAILFRTITNDSTSGAPKEYLRAQRNLAIEISPNYFINKNISVGVYYLYGYCLEDYSIKNTHYLTLNAGFYNVPLPAKFYLKFTPQVYYLYMDKEDGFYVSSILTISNKKIPLSVSALVNKAIQTNITASKDFVWNVTLIYSFNRKYVEYNI